MKKQKKEHLGMKYEDGIYFNIPEDQYHEIERLSASGINKMLVSPADFWANSWFNKDQEEKEDTEAQIFGRAYHTAMFEPHLLDQKYVTEIDRDDYPGILTSGSEIEVQLELMSESKTVKGEKVLDKAYRLDALGYQGKILHIIQKEWEDNLNGRSPLKAKVWKQLQADIAAISKIPELQKHVTGGFAEVTVLWTDKRTGIKMKCRFDYLKPDELCDYKTFENSLGKNLKQCISHAVQYNRYYIQICLYHNVTELIRKKEIDCIDANEAQQEMINQIQQRSEPLPAWFVFQQKKNVPNILAYEFKIFANPHESHENNQAGSDHSTEQSVAKMTMRHSGIHMKAQAEIDAMMNMFNFYKETYEDGEPWRPVMPTGTISDDDFSPFWLEI